MPKPTPDWNKIQRFIKYRLRPEPFTYDKISGLILTSNGKPTNKKTLWNWNKKYVQGGVHNSRL